MHLQVQCPCKAVYVPKAYTDLLYDAPAGHGVRDFRKRETLKLNAVSEDFINLIIENESLMAEWLEQASQ